MMKIYNSLTQNQEKLVPIKPKKITIYVCGITPYDTTHLGHAFTYISFDVLIKYLKYKGFEVEYTQNVTDINDRDNDILKRAKEQNIDWQDLAQYWTDKFLTDMESLNWTKPTHYLKASENIPAMLDLIKKLIDNGLGYIVNGSVYLNVQKDHDYGKLSRLTKDNMLKVAQDFEEGIDNPEKKYPLDITLWRSSSPNQEPHIPSFDSPWGKGRPGWHLECSAMAISSLGEQIDIHGGGTDLIYPHHEAEIAQSEGATKKVPFVKYWMHTGAVHYQSEKMSKSLGNLMMVSTLLENYSANAIRWVLLSHHYQEPWEFKEEELENAEEIIQKLQNIIPTKKKQLAKGSSQQSSVSEIPPLPLVGWNDIINKFEQAMDDNLNTPKVLELLSSLTHNSIKNPNQKDLETLKIIYKTLGFN